MKNKKEDKNKKTKNNHRILRTTWMLLTLILIGLLVFVLYQKHTLFFVLLLSYLFAVVLFVLYEVVLLYELYKEKPLNKKKIHNGMIQIYLGGISLVTAVFSLILATIMSLTNEVALFVFIGLTLIATFFTFPIVENLTNKILE